MKQTQVAVHTHKLLPRGWVVLGLALAAWALFVALGASFMALFNFIASTL